MRFATCDDGSMDGELLLVSADGTRAARVGEPAPSLLRLVQDWDRCLPAVQALAAALESGSAAHRAFDAAACRAPLPRAPQWLDGSAFLNHQRLMARAFNTPPIPAYDTIPVIYQGASDDFLGPCEDVSLPDTAHGIDFEGEFGVIVDDTPMGISPQTALAHVRLLVQLNDWSLRALGSQEVRTGFGFIQAKPSTSFAPLAVTPDTLGAAWRGGVVHLDLHIAWNGAFFGRANGGEMHFHFGELIAHAARTRRLRAGTIVGSGTVSNGDRQVGSSCIAERRMIEMLEHGQARTAFMAFGDQVRMEARHPGTAPGSGPFGVIAQPVLATDGQGQ